MSKTIPVAVLLLTLAACTPVNKLPYQEPAGGATAEILFHNATPGRTEMALFEDAAACTGRRHLPALLIGEERAVQVPAGRLLAFQVRHLVPNTTPPRYCEVLASFDPVPGASYEVSIRTDGDRPCTAHVRQLGGPLAERSSQVLLRAPVKSQDEDGPFCFPIQ